MSDWQSHVHNHGPIVQLAPSLWVVKGSLPHGGLPRNMVIARVNQNELVIHSAVALNDLSMRELEILGKPKYLIVPNQMHRLDAAAYKARYPEIQVLCPKAAADAVSKKVQPTGHCEDILPQLGITCHVPAGIKPSELAYELDVGDGKALIVTDLFFNLPHMPGLFGFLFKHLGSTGFFGITKIGQLLMLKNRAECKAWLEDLAKREIKYICVAHGDSIVRQASQRLKEAAARL